jgi:aldehyde dehydrogenase family 7 protein A1
MPDANMQLALQAITFSALGTAGQRCTTTRRLFLHSSIASNFTKSLVDAYKSVSTRMGHPLDPNTLVGPVHSADTVKRFESAIAKIKEQGGEIVVGGKKVEMKGDLAGGNYVEPTIVLVKDQQTCSMMKEETFAPSKSTVLFS